MKKSTLSICVILFLFACKKNDPNKPLTSGSLVTSVWSTNFSEHNLLLDSFSYDKNGNITQIIEWHLDSTWSPTLQDSTVWNFTYPGTGSNPSSYSNNFYNSSDANLNFSETHHLSYDGQGRIKFDTSLLTYPSYTLERARYFKYTSSFIVINQLNAKDATDTIFLYNGNVMQFSAFADSSVVEEPDYIDYYTYTNTLNPLFNTNSSSGIGPLLNVLTETDLISKNVPATIKDYYGDVDLLLTYTTNPSGLPVKASAKDRNTGELVGSITYNYK